ncbi:MAG: phage holin family protein [Planctomycetaceae bacterium]
MSTTNGKYTPETSPSFRKDVGELSSDLIALGELQLQLIGVDSKEACQKAIFPGVLIVMALGLLIGAAPLFLFAITWWLLTVTTLTQPVAALIVVGGALLIAGLLLYLAWKGLSHSMEILNRSRTELKNNIFWIKSILSSRKKKECSTVS